MKANNAKVMMIEVIEAVAKKCEDGVYSIPENKVAELVQAIEASEKFATLEKDGVVYVVYKSKMRPSGAIAQYKVVKARKVSKKAVDAVKETKATKKVVAKAKKTEEKPEGLMALTIKELRAMSKELGLPYMRKHRALSKVVLVANIEAMQATA